MTEFADIVISGNVVLHKRSLALAGKVPKHHALNVNSKGQVKGQLRADIAGTAVYYGRSSFFYPLNDDVGVKVAFSLGSFRGTARGRLTKVHRQSCSYAEAGFGPACYGVTELHLDLVRGDKHRIRTARGILLDRIHPPADAWDSLARGVLYDFDALDVAVHPNHTPFGYLKLCDKVIAMRKQKKLPFVGGRNGFAYGLKIGDVGYCMKRKRWLVLDCG